MIHCKWFTSVSLSALCLMRSDTLYKEAHVLQLVLGPTNITVQIYCTIPYKCVHRCTLHNLSSTDLHYCARFLVTHGRTSALPFAMTYQAETVKEILSSS